MFYFKNYLEILAIFTLLYLSENANSEKIIFEELSDDWRLTNQNGTIDVPIPKLPSGVYSALSGQYGDILKSYNDVNLRWIALDNWTYTKIFNVSMTSVLKVRCVNLTLHGIDTIAEVRLNGKSLGRTNNMFVRYSYDVKTLLQEENKLEIQIKSPIYAAMEQAEAIRTTGNFTEPRPKCAENPNVECYGNLLRKMQLSFGGNGIPSVPSMGIWKPVTLEFFEVAIMRDVDVALRQSGKNWNLDVRAFLSVGLEDNFNAELTFYAPDFMEMPINANRSIINATNPVLEFQHKISANEIELWWPNGFGKQILYPMYFSANCWIVEGGPKLRDRTISNKSLLIGFRTVELVEEEVATGNTFLFKVNGVELFMKGAIYLPANILPEFSRNEDTMLFMLKSAKDAHMNMLRVWGGGLYESDEFYNLADMFGLLVWQDMPFTSATYPVTEDFLESVRLETRQNLQRIAYHPSLALVATNDEVELALANDTFNTTENLQNYTKEYKELFSNTLAAEINATVGRNFSNRLPVLMSTPSNGIKQPAGEISANPQDTDYGDMHIMDMNKAEWNPDKYPRPRFVSKYGFPSIPINRTWQNTLGAHDQLNDLIKNRQTSLNDAKIINTFIAKYFPQLNVSAANYIETLIYFSQISQALTTKLATELFRSQRATEHKTMGALYWQLNDVWVAPTWSSLDYYGNYKLIYYWSKEFLAPTAIMALYDAEHKAINVTYVRDVVNADPEIFNITMNMYLWSEIYLKKTITWQAILLQNEPQLKQISLDRIYTDELTQNNCLLEFLLSASNQIVSRTYFFPGSYDDASGISDPEITVCGLEESKPEDCNIYKNVRSYSLRVTIKRPALFVYIEINHPRVKRYWLSQNGFIQVLPVKTVQLQIEKEPTDCIEITADNIKILTLNQFIAPPENDDGDDYRITVSSCHDVVSD